MSDDAAEVPTGARPEVFTAHRGAAYIRARMLPDGVYELEHRADPGEQRYQLYTSDPVLVRDVLCAWIDEDPRWRNTAPWAEIDPAIAELTAVRTELEGLLDGLTAMDDIQAAMDRVDELMDFGRIDPDEP